MRIGVSGVKMPRLAGAEISPTEKDGYVQANPGNSQGYRRHSARSNLSHTIRQRGLVLIGNGQSQALVPSASAVLSAVGTGIRMSPVRGIGDHKVDGTIPDTGPVEQHYPARDFIGGGRSLGNVRLQAY
jgi:hypothetical protein